MSLTSLLLRLPFPFPPPHLISPKAPGPGYSRPKSVRISSTQRSVRFGFPNRLHAADLASRARHRTAALRQKDEAESYTEWVEAAALLDIVDGHYR